MKTRYAIHRRQFIKTGMLAAAAGFAGPGFAHGKAAELAVKPARDPFRGLKIGIASYTYRKFTLDEAIAMTQEAGLKYINLKDAHLPMKTTRAERQAVRQKVEAAGLTLMGGGVIYLTTPDADFRGAFEYVIDASMPLMVTSIAPPLLDTLEKWAKEYDVRVAINNRGPGQANFPSPYDIYRAIKSRDARLGICMDTGHTARLGEDPARAIHEYRSRMFDFHLKDVTLAKPEGKSVEIGRGAVDMVAVMKELLRQKFPYHVGIECDEKEDAPQSDVLGSVAYLRGVLAAL